MTGAPPRVAADDEREEASVSREVPCFDHAFDEALVCACGVSWWAHQREPQACRLNARGRNRGEVPRPRARRRGD